MDCVCIFTLGTFFAILWVWDKADKAMEMAKEIEAQDLHRLCARIERKVFANADEIYGIKNVVIQSLEEDIERLKIRIEYLEKKLQ